MCARRIFPVYLLISPSSWSSSCTLLPTLLKPQRVLLFAGILCLRNARCPLAGRIDSSQRADDCHPNLPRIGHYSQWVARGKPVVPGRERSGGRWRGKVYVSFTTSSPGSRSTSVRPGAAGCGTDSQKLQKEPAEDTEPALCGALRVDATQCDDNGCEAGTPKGTQTPVAGMRTRYPRPLDDGGTLFHFWLGIGRAGPIRLRSKPALSLPKQAGSASAAVTHPPCCQSQPAQRQERERGGFGKKGQAM